MSELKEDFNDLVIVIAIAIIIKGIVTMEGIEAKMILLHNKSQMKQFNVVLFSLSIFPN